MDYFAGVRFTFKELGISSGNYSYQTAESAEVQLANGP